MLMLAGDKMMPVKRLKLDRMSKLDRGIHGG